MWIISKRFVVVFNIFFFFQAEDGIRDFCLSRGLGDVYKRQVKELFINDLIDLSEYKKRIDELESKIIVTAPKPRANTARLKKLLETNALSFYQTFTRDEKRAFWRGIIKELHIYRGTVQGPPIFL